MARELRPCGTVGGYSRHRSRGEQPCQECQTAWRDYHRARRAAGYAPPEVKRQLAPCGTYAAAQRHAKHGEELCEPCEQAVRDYKAEHARKLRAQQRERRQELDALIGEVFT